MAVWALILCTLTLINITMVGAMVSLVGNIPDSSFLAILSRYLGGKARPPGAIIYPLEAASRLANIRVKLLWAAVVGAVSGLCLTVWAFIEGWGVEAMLALTIWLLAANVAFLAIPLGTWKRRAGGIKEDDVEEAARKSMPIMREEAEGHPDQDPGGNRSDSISAGRHEGKL